MAGRCSRCELKRVMRCRGVLPKFPSFRTLLGGVSVGAISPLALNFKDSTLADTGQWVFGAVTQPDRCGMLRTPPPNCHCQLHTEFCHVVQLLKSDRTPDFVIGMPLQALALRLRNVWQAIEPLHVSDSSCPGTAAPASPPACAALPPPALAFPSRAACIAHWAVIC